MKLLNKFIDSNKLKICDLQYDQDSIIIHTYYNLILTITKKQNDMYRILLTCFINSEDFFIENYLLDLYSTCMLIQDCLDGYYEYVDTQEKDCD